jgi:hypothetical protein
VASIPDTLLSDDISSFQLPIILDNPNQDSISGFTFTIEFDSGVIDISSYIKSDLTNGFYIQENNSEDGLYRITGASSNEIVESGVLLYLEANVIRIGACEYE